MKRFIYTVEIHICLVDWLHKFWKLEVGFWKLEVEFWKLEVEFWKLQLPKNFTKNDWLAGSKNFGSWKLDAGSWSFWKLGNKFLQGLYTVSVMFPTKI